MFLGTHTPRLDDKGRLALPAKFRAELEGGLVITKGQQRCLSGFPIAEFVRVTEQLRSVSGSFSSGGSGSNASPAGASSQDYTRIFFAGASQETPDSQGRITIPASLRDYAGLVKDCTVIGHNARFEIWDATAWQDYLGRVEVSYADGNEVPVWL